MVKYHLLTLHHRQPICTTLLFAKILQEAQFVVLAQWDILAIIEEYTTLSIAAYTFKIDNIGAVYSKEAIRRERCLHILQSKERGDAMATLDM